MEEGGKKGGEGTERSLPVAPPRDWRRAGIVVLIVAAGAAASLAALAATVLGGGRSTVLVPHPYLAPYVDFNANEGSAGPRHNYAALNFQAKKAGASQEWLQYSLHHDGSLQQAKRPGRVVRAPRRGGRARAPATRLTAALSVANSKSTRSGDAGAGEENGGKQAIIESSGSFQDDDGALFGEDTFDQAQAPSGSAPTPDQQGDGGQYYQDEPRDDDYDDEYCEDEYGNEVSCDMCVDEQGNEVECEDDEYCVDEQGREVPCEEPEPEPQRPSVFLTSIVKAVSADEMPQAASKELKKSVNSVDAAKRELKRAATLKAAASVDEKRADGLEGRLAELVKYQHAKQRYADAQEGLARQADAEYKAEEDEVDAMEGSHAHAEEELHGSRGVEGTHNDGSGGSGVTTSLQQRLRRHLPLLRVVDKLVQRVGAGGHRRPRGRHPRSRHQLPAQRGGH